MTLQDATTPTSAMAGEAENWMPPAAPKLTWQTLTTW